tara:strand:- start:5562 stop:6614 length:1053 start_codon:yes stop_codon:yes gene_type:complete
VSIYWLFYALVSIFSLKFIKFEINLSKLLNFIFLIILALFIGLRYEVGGDWDIYKNDFYENISSFNLLKFDYVRDFGYEFISYLIFNLEFEIYILNLILAFLFVYSLNKFSINFSDNYWIIFVIAFPYLVTVGAMGFVRQAAAFSFILLSLCYYQKKDVIKFLILFLGALLFHKSAAILLPFLLISNLKLNIKFNLIILILIILAYIIISPEITRISSYVSESSKYASSGVIPRIVLNILPGLIFLLFFKKLRFKNNIDTVIILITLFQIFLLYFINNNTSTFIDRLIINFYFIQLLVLSRLYLILPSYKNVINILIIIFYGLIYYIWMEYSLHSYAWTPYKNIIFEILK